MFGQIKHNKFRPTVNKFITRIILLKSESLKLNDFDSNIQILEI